MIELPRYLASEPMSRTVMNMMNRFQMEHYSSPYIHGYWGLAGSLLLALSAFFLIRGSNPESIPLSDSIYRTMIAAIFIAGAALRIVQYAGLPHGLWTDNGMEGLHCLTVLKYLEFPIYFHSNYGYEPIMPYLITGCIALLGNIAVATRLPGLFVSLATLLICMRFVQRHYDRFTAVTASAFLAFSLSHIVLSRQGFRCILMPLFALLIMHWMLRAFDENNSRHFITAGIFLGLSNYSYVGIRFFVFVPFVMILHQLMMRRLDLKKSFSATVRIYLPAAVVIAPLMMYFATQPNLFSGRAASTVIFNQPNSWLELVHNTRQLLGMFSLAGDLQPRHNVMALPLFNPLESIFFMMGLFFVVRQFRVLKYGSLVLWMSVMMVPSWITEGAPSFMRLLAMFPAAWLIAAIGLREFSIRCWRFCRHGWLVPVGVLLFGVIYSAVNIFSVWKESLETMPESKGSHYGFCEDEYDLAQVFIASPEKEFIVSPQIFLHPSVQYLCYGKKGLILNSDPQDLESYLRGKESATFVFTSVERNLWWARTNRDKDFFFWQRREYNVSDQQFRDVLSNHYGTHLPVMASDQRLEARLMEVFPDAPKEKVGIFTLVRCWRNHETTSLIIQR